MAKNKFDRVSVPDGYQVSILHSLGDPLQPVDAAWQGDGSETAESYARRVGDGHDGMYFFGLADNGKWDARRSDKGLLAVNHEYVVSPYVLHPWGITKGAQRMAAEARKEMLVHGVSVVEVQRTSDKDSSHGNGVALVQGSRFNRRVTATTEMDITGPARGHERVRTRFSADGTRTRGTQNNCACGHTPWGTYLTCEENWTNAVSRAAGDNARRSAVEVTSLNRYNLPDNRASAYRWDAAGTEDLFARWSSSVTGASAADDYRHIAQTFGWVVEIDPFSPHPPLPSARHWGVSAMKVRGLHPWWPGNRWCFTWATMRPTSTSTSLCRLPRGIRQMPTVAWLLGRNTWMRALCTWPGLTQTVRVSGWN